MGRLWEIGCFAGWFEVDLHAGVEKGMVGGITGGGALIDRKCGGVNVELVGLSVVLFDEVGDVFHPLDDVEMF